MPEYIRRPYTVHAEKTKSKKKIRTLEGTMTADKGDYVVTGLRGEKWPVKEEIFHESYRTTKITKMKLSDLIPNPVNRILERGKIRDIKTAIKESGKIKPLVYTEVMTESGKKKMLTDGHHRYVALKEMGYKDVPAVMADERGVDTANDQEPGTVKKVHSPYILIKAKKPCPEGYRRGSDGKCHRTTGPYYGGGVLVVRPPKEDDDGETPPTNGNGTTNGTTKKKVDQTPGYQKETEQIRENRKSDAAQKPHTFKAAEWTHPNGHSRCILCGDEQPISGRCDGYESPRETKDKFAKDVSDFILNKHLQGEHDQSTHSPTGRAAVDRPTETRTQEARAGTLEGGAVHMATIAIPAIVVGALLRFAPMAGFGAIGVGAAFLLYEVPQLIFRMVEGGVRGYHGDRPYRLEQEDKDRKKFAKVEVGVKDRVGRTMTRGDHVLVKGKKGAYVGTYMGQDRVRIINRDKFVDLKTTTQNRIKISTEDEILSSDPKNAVITAQVAEQLMRERKFLIDNAKRLKQKKFVKGHKPRIPTGQAPKPTGKPSIPSGLPPQKQTGHYNPARRSTFVKHPGHPDQGVHDPTRGRGKAKPDISEDKPETPIPPKLKTFQGIKDYLGQGIKVIVSTEKDYLKTDENRRRSVGLKRILQNQSKDLVMQSWHEGEKPIERSYIVTPNNTKALKDIVSLAFDPNELNQESIIIIRNGAAEARYQDKRPSLHTTVRETREVPSAKGYYSQVGNIRYVFDFKRKKLAKHAQHDQSTHGRRSGVTAPSSVNAPNPVAIKAAQSYVKRAGLTGLTRHEPVRVDKIRARRIADAYDNMKHDPDNSEVKAAYTAMADEVAEQYKMLPIRIQYTKGDPYANSEDMRRDVRENKRLKIFTGGEPHPLLGAKGQDGVTINDNFRAVHDYFGHAMRGYQFGPSGEENAWIEHSKMFSPLAQRAMTTETRGQNSWYNFSKENERRKPKDKKFAEQKVGILPDEFLPKSARRKVRKYATQGFRTPSGEHTIGERLNAPRTRAVKKDEDRHQPSSNGSKKLTKERLQELRDLVAKLNRMGKGYTTADVIGLQLNREDLQEELVHEYPGKAKKMNSEYNSERPIKNPEAHQDQWGR